MTPLYQTRHFADQAGRDAYDRDNAHQRLGLFAAYTLRDHGPSRFNKPTVILIASWYLSHRYRVGEPDAIQVGHTADDYVTCWSGSRSSRTCSRWSADRAPIGGQGRVRMRTSAIGGSWLRRHASARAAG